MKRALFLTFMLLLVVASFTMVALADNSTSPAQYCKQFNLPQPIYNACVVCAAHGSLVPFGDGPICVCKTLMSGFGGPPPFSSLGECLQALK